MAKKAGRPPGSQNKVGKDEKEFIKGLLGDTQEQFRLAFMRYANNVDKNEEDRKFFMSVRQDLMKMIVPKPVEVDMSMDQDDFKALLGMAHKFNDEA
mgnify:CR=1 FL=1